MAQTSDVIVVLVVALLAWRWRIIYVGRSLGSRWSNVVG